MEKLMKELDKLQMELRNVNVSELTDVEYTEYKKKANRMTELINMLYKK